MTERKVVIPGEIIKEGNDFLPGDGTEKQGNNIIALKFGLAEEQDRLVKVIPLSGVYIPRRGNVVIGRVTNVTFNGWCIDIDTSENSFLPLAEVPRFINKNELEEMMDIGDMVVAKIWNIGGRGIDLSINSRGLGKIDEGLVIKVNPHKVPRIIGKEGSMINLIKEKTKCEITVGQNGFIWIQGKKIEEEILSKNAINFICEKSFVSGLTEEVENWFAKNGGEKWKEDWEEHLSPEN